MEGTISFLKRVLGLARCYTKGWEHYAAMIEERIVQHQLRREPQWTDSVAVGSEGFVREIASRIPGRQKLEVVGEVDRWELGEVGGLYDASRRRLS